MKRYSVEATGSDGSLRKCYRGQAAGWGKLCLVHSPHLRPVPQLQPSPASLASPGSSRQQTRSREMSGVPQAAGGSPEGTMAANLHEEVALMRYRAVGSRRGPQGTEAQPQR